ncbi:MAG: FAD:protein FMN transferase [Gammaproteobacteria bacterium]|nr:FAD:protein FMN transferase [Gammaproteobacteria bacterium]
MERAVVLRRFLMFAGCLLWSVVATAEWYTNEQAIMGTVIRTELWSDDPLTAAEAIRLVNEEMHRIDRSMSTYKPDSEISRINRDAAKNPVTISAELLELIARGIEMSRLTHGAFDITYASVGQLYDFRAGVRPDEKQIAATLPAINYRFVELDLVERTVFFARQGVRIDLGGIAKGYAVERGAGILRAQGIAHGLVSAGGDSRVLGDRRGAPWIVGVRDPRNSDRVVARLPLIDEAISTSGDYERFFEEDGVRYHHIISPATGHSASEVRSVTIIGPDATMTDGLATSVFVMGVENGLQLIDSLDDFEAVIVDQHGRLHRSGGFLPPKK